jgi:O-antigen ligase
LNSFFSRRESGSRKRLGYLLGTCFYVLFFGIFYWKYVPLIKGYQIVLAPLLVAIAAVTAAHLRLGILFFVFAFPLVNCLPYVFRIYEDVPQAPVALVLFLAFFLGWLIHSAFSGATEKVRYPIFKPLGLLSLIIVVSAVITSLRYTDFFPFLAPHAHELAVNVNGVRAGGAVMSVLFNFFSYLTGFLFFAILSRTLRSKEYVKALLLTFSFSLSVVLIFSIVQKFYSPSLANTPLWVRLDRINSTFKDPNSFGVILSASLPLLLGLAIAAERRSRVFFSALILLGLFVFPFTGSRSGFLGLGLSLLIFFLLFLKERKIKYRKQLVYIIALFLVVIVFFVSFSVFYQKSNLYHRIELSLDSLKKEGSLNKVFTQKIDFWRVALSMVKEYPLSGVGLGAYIIEMPDYLKQMKLPFRLTDSAENYVLQVVSELGLIGLFLFFWVFLEIYRRAKTSWTESPLQGRERVILIGAISGMGAILANYFFHSYIGSFEVKYFFWLLVSLIFFGAVDTQASSAGPAPKRGGRLLPSLAVVIFASVHLMNSLHSLSIEERRERFGWAQNFGFYAWEKDERGFRFRWAQKHAGLVIENSATFLTIPMRASHPDLARDPVKVDIYVSDRHFRRKKLFQTLVFKNSGWRDAELALPESTEKNIFLIFDTSREWQPLRHSGVPDPRWLALAMGDYWFKYPKELPRERIGGKQTISAKNWRGRFKDKLSAEGTSFVRFKARQKDIAIRLQIRGQKAFGLGPSIVVRLGNRIIGRAVIDEEGWTSLVFEAPAEEGENVLSVEFTNDVRMASLRQDRNVFLGDVEILYLHPKPGS